MEHPHDSYQIGFADVGAEAVEQTGRPLGELAREYGCDGDDVAGVDSPADGWRVLLSRAGITVIGAPTVDDDHRWRIAQIDNGGLHVHPDTERLRPGRQERRRGLELRWPRVMIDQVTRAADFPAEFVVDIVNVGDTRWQPDGDGFRVVGTFTDPGATGFAIGWTGSGQDRAVPLDPGEYARVPVLLHSSATLEPGTHDLHAVLVDLSLTTMTPLTVELSADDISRHRRAPSVQDAPAALHRRQRAFDVQRLSAQLAATAALGPLVEALKPVTSRRQALSTISAILDCDATAAEGVWMTPLGELLPLAAPEARTRLEALDELED